MTKSYRIKANPGTDKNIRVQIDQDFDLIEILSLKLRQDEIYTRFCSDYGIIAGRVIANGGYGVPNVSISVFVPLTTEDENDEVISTLYPYKTLSDKNEDGYRYNLLPYVQEYGGHTPTGTFPDREDLLNRAEVLEVYEKYYKFTVRTNDSGDFMIVGVPLGQQKVVMDMDLSNIGCFSQRPSDLMRMGLGVQGQFAGSQFKSNSNLAMLPQIVNVNKEAEVDAFWGDTNSCSIGITRVDFDLRDLGIEISPQAIFMGSLFSNSDEDELKLSCKPSINTGALCDLVTQTGLILAIRQTIYSDVDGFPVLEEYKFEDGGNVIDDNGTWLVEVPMNLDYVTTNEFGEQILSNDPKNGIPTKAKYRFRIRYQVEAPNNTDIMRADYLVPNIKEYGWASTSVNEPDNLTLQEKSYAFSLNWNDYGDTTTILGRQIIQEAIDCKDKFFEFNYNRVYTVSAFIDRWKWGYLPSRILGIKEITERTCTATTNRFPTNDAHFRFDLIFFVVYFIISIFYPLIYIFIITLHVLAWLYEIIVRLWNRLANFWNDNIVSLCYKINDVFDKFNWDGFNCDKWLLDIIEPKNPFARYSLPMISYPDCESCSCEIIQVADELLELYQDAGNFSPLIDSNSVRTYSTYQETYMANLIRNLDTTQGTDLNFDFTNETLNTSIAQGFAGYLGDKSNDKYKLYKTPVITWPSQFSSSAAVGFTVNWSQRLNWLNSTQTYYVNGNYLKTTIKNLHPVTNVETPSTPFYDQPLILVCDQGTLSNMGNPGTLLSFTKIEDIVDLNITGNTLNSFGTNSITGTAAYNTTNLVTRGISYMNPSGNLQSVGIKLKLTNEKMPYNYKAGVEYFQLITGGTMSSLEGLVDFNSYGAIQQAVYDHGMKFRWGYGLYTDTQTSPFGGFDDSVYTIDTDSFGGIYIGGNFTSYNTSISAPKIIKLNSNGIVDNTFNYGSGFNGLVRTLVVQPDGKILVGGDFSTYQGGYAGKMIRLNSDGTIDSNAFGFDLPVHKITLQPNGKILVGGEFTDYNGSSKKRIIRLNSDGTIDGTFNIGTGAFNGFNDVVRDITLQSDNKILVGGDFQNYNSFGSNALFAVRLNVNGTIDNTFTTLAFGSNINNSVYSIKQSLDGSGDIYIGGDFTIYKGVVVGRIVKTDSFGTRIPSFSHSAPATALRDFNSTVRVIYNYLDGAGNEKLLVGGNFTTYVNESLQNIIRPEIIRLDSNGNNDTTFNLTSSWPINYPGFGVFTFKRQTDTKVIIGGDFSSGGGTGNRIKRFLDNGTSDFTTSTSVAYPLGYNQWVNVNRIYNAIPKQIVSNFANKEIIFLTRGVDPYTQKQRIEYDLSSMFGRPQGTIKILGDFYLNIPIQSNTGNLTSTQTWQSPGVTNQTWRTDALTPESHNVINNNNNKLFHYPFCSPSTGIVGNILTPIFQSFTGFTNNSLKYYCSMDKSESNFVSYNGDLYNVASFTTPSGVFSPLKYNWQNGYNTIALTWFGGDPPASITETYYDSVTYEQGNIEGCSLIASKTTPGIGFNINNTATPVFTRVFSPAYHLNNTPDCNLTNNGRLVLRSSRLPTSTDTQVSGNSSYAMFLNDNFKIYKILEGGVSTQLTFVPFTPLGIGTGEDFLDRPTGSTVSDLVINSLSCEGMVPLACYSGNGESFGVETPCTDNFEGNLERQTVVGGCYYFVSKEYLSKEELKRDANNLAEWKSRFIFSFAACRDIFSHNFHNNWVNGTLYSFGFQKQTIFDENNNPIQKFCGSPYSANAPHQGPIYYDNIKKSYFYRATPYSNTENKFVGQLPRKKSWITGQWGSAEDFTGVNNRNIHFPTTIMDLGPRDEFAKEICLNPQLDGYLIDTIKSTTFSPTDTILLFFFLSRLLSTTAAQKYLGLGNSSVFALFSRSGLRIDGDVAQMFSINSEYGTLPFNDQFYDDNDVYLSTSNGDPVIGVLYSADTENRRLLTPGTLTFGNVLQTNGYPSTQTVPMYMWTRDDSNGYVSILGSEENNWYTNLEGINAYPYQQMSFNSTPYFQATNGDNTGYIFNYTSAGEPTFNPSVNQANPNFVVGAPYHFYFGLFRGKSAINRYIKKYIINTTI